MLNWTSPSGTLRMELLLARWNERRHPLRIGGPRYRSWLAIHVLQHVANICRITRFLYRQGLRCGQNAPKCHKSQLRFAIRRLGFLELDIILYRVWLYDSRGDVLAHPVLSQRYFEPRKECYNCRAKSLGMPTSDFNVRLALLLNTYWQIGLSPFE